MKHSLRKPCNDCPFRRASTEGWLGRGDPAHFISAALADFYKSEDGQTDEALPCHQTVDYTDREWKSALPDAEVCVGALVFYRNVDRFKLPRQPERSDLIAATKADPETVFQTVDEFVAHHTSKRSMRSWERR